MLAVLRRRPPPLVSVLTGPQPSDRSPYRILHTATNILGSPRTDRLTYLLRNPRQLLFQLSCLSTFFELTSQALQQLISHNQFLSKKVNESLVFLINSEITTKDSKKVALDPLVIKSVNRTVNRVHSGCSIAMRSALQLLSLCLLSSHS